MNAKGVIYDELVELATTERVSRLCNRVSIGRGIMALQVLNGDVKGHDKRPNFEPARKEALVVIGDSNPDITDNVLKVAVYIALRLDEDAIESLSDAGMTFSQVYAMLCYFKDKSSAVRVFLCEVRAGRAKDFARFNRARQGGGSTVSRPAAAGSIVVPGEVTVESACEILVKIIERIPPAQFSTALRRAYLKAKSSTLAGV